MLVKKKKPTKIEAFYRTERTDAKIGERILQVLRKYCRIKD